MKPKSSRGIAKPHNSTQKTISGSDYCFQHPRIGRELNQGTHEGILIDTTSRILIEKSLAWGRRRRIGESGNTPIGVQGNKLRIFTYSGEIPGVMGRFIRWKDELHRSKNLRSYIRCFLLRMLWHTSVISILSEMEWEGRSVHYGRPYDPQQSSASSFLKYREA